MNNRMVCMAVLDLIWTVTSYAALLAFITLMGVIIFKIGFTSFKLAMNTVGATRGIENIKGVVNSSDRRKTGESDEIEIIISYITGFVQNVIERNHHARYAYDLLRVELIISYMNSLEGFVQSKLEKVDYAGYVSKLLENEKVNSRVDSLKSFIQSKREKNFARYAYIQLFKK